MLWFNCNPGYAAEGSHWAQCKPGGSWDPPVLSCEQVTCPQPPNIANGLHSGRSSARFPHGTTVSYSCKDGFELVGNVSINCSAVGRWSRPLPRCQAIGCQRPTVRNGKVQVPKDTYEAGETLWFDCNPGYAAEGSHRAQCKPGGSWDPPVLSCEQVRPCPMPPKISNGDHNRHGEAFFTTGMSVTYTCDPTFYLVGNAHVVCRASGTWSQPSPLPLCDLLHGPIIPHGKHTGRLLDEFHYGISVTYSCEPGYPLHGDASIFCTTQDGKNGVWSGPPPVCGEAGCSAPQIQNGRIVSAPRSTYTHNDTVTFECEPGYIIHGPRVVQCQQNNTWQPPVPICEQGKWPDSTSGATLPQCPTAL
uniref:Sushi domain-containing protein n=1 Tax=Coturnix japonica TaxID=93934 RepID=A0A8C2TT75_COTJA